MPLLLRQSIRSTLQVTRTASNPLQAKFRPSPPTSFPAVPTRNFSACLQCRFSRQSGLYSAYDDKGKPNSDAERLHQALKEASSNTNPIPETGNVAKEPPLDTSAVEVDRAAEQGAPQEVEKESIYRTEAEHEKSQGTGADGAPSGGLPSYLESRRSQVSKQFTTMMDNIQSNVFVAGQRLNDLTGYSGIEALKNEIHSQGTSHTYLQNRLHIVILKLTSFRST